MHDIDLFISRVADMCAQFNMRAPVLVSKLVCGTVFMEWDFRMLSTSGFAPMTRLSALSHVWGVTITVISFKTPTVTVALSPAYADDAVEEGHMMSADSAISATRHMAADYFRTRVECEKRKRTPEDEESLVDFREQLLAFMSGNTNRAWMCTNSFKVYVRKAHHVPPVAYGDAQIAGTLDLASFEVIEDCRRRGLMTELVKIGMEVADMYGRHMFIENSMHKGVTDALQKLGLTPVLVSDEPHVCHLWHMHKPHDSAA